MTTLQSDNPGFIFLAFPFAYVILDKLFGLSVPVSLTIECNLSKVVIRLIYVKGVEHSLSYNA